MIRSTFTALATLLATAGAAAAQETRQDTPRLKELVTVTADLVRIGDLVENAGAAANIAVFRAPDLGQTGTVPVVRVTEVLRPHDVPRFATNGLSEVVVTRLSRAITGKEIEERIARAFGGQYGFGDARSLAVTIDRDVRTMHVESSNAAELAVARMGIDPRSGRFDIAFELPGSAVARRLPLRFTGTVTEMVETATVTRNIARGDTIKASDVSFERRPKAEVAGDITVPEQAVGLSAKRTLRAGQLLRPADLIKADVIQRNEAVTIFYEVPGIRLTVRGKAAEAGGVGDLINVLNVQSNRTVQAKVTGPGRVTIAAATPLLAAAAAPASENQASPSAE